MSREKMTQNSSENDSDSGQEFGGLIRGLMRSSFRVIGRSSLGSFPLPRPQTIAVSTANIGDLLDLHGHVKDATASHGHVSGFQRVRKVAASVVPGFLKTSVCGTALFAIYDQTIVVRNHFDHWSTTFVCGAGAGLSHGLIVSTWDSMTEQLKRMRSLKSFNPLPQGKLLSYSFHGTLLSHTLVHGSLFWVYETTKTILESTMGAEIEYIAEELEAFNNKELKKGSKSFWSTDSEEKERFQQSLSPAIISRAQTVSKVVCVFLAGSLAGMVSEGMNAYLEIIESAGLSAWKQMKNSKRPTLRLLLPATIPSSAGFLAYEFGKFEE